MSYMRGNYYAWVGGDEGEESITLHGHDSYCGCGEHDKHPSISLPFAVFDELVVMRFAELLKEGKVAETVGRVAADGFGNFGAVDLANLCGFDPMETWAEEMQASKEAHLAECKTPGDCEKPGLHRHRHHGRKVHS